MCGTSFQSASRPARSSLDEGSSLTPQRRPTSTHHEQVSQRRSDHRTNDTRSTAASETVSVQILPATRSNIASVGAGMSHCNWTHSSRHQHYAMPEQFYRCALRRFCCSPRPDSLTVDVRHNVTGILHYRPLPPNFS